MAFAKFKGNLHIIDGEIPVGAIMAWDPYVYFYCDFGQVWVYYLNFWNRHNLLDYL